jgi:hypothetical protein
MFTGLTEYSVDSEISCDARKLARTPGLKKKNNWYEIEN